MQPCFNLRLYKVWKASLSFKCLGLMKALHFNKESFSLSAYRRIKRSIVSAFISCHAGVVRLSTCHCVSGFYNTWSSDGSLSLALILPFFFPVRYFETLPLVIHITALLTHNLAADNYQGWFSLESKQQDGARLFHYLLLLLCFFLFF